MMKFLTVLYSIPADVVPITKFLLFMRNLAREVHSRDPSKGSPYDVAQHLIHVGQLDKPTVKPIDLALYSPTFTSIVRHLTNISSSNTTTQMVALKDIQASLTEASAKLLETLLKVLREKSENRQAIAFERFVDLHLITNQQGRNAFHMLCMSRATAIIRILQGVFIPLMQSYDLAKRVLQNIESVADERGHSAISYCRMRYGHSSMNSIENDGDVMYAMEEFMRELKKGFQNGSNSSDVEVNVNVGLAGEQSITASIADVTSASIVNKSEQSQRGNSYTGGWSTDQLRLPTAYSAPACDIMEVHATSLPSAEDFFARYINTATPVIFRGAAITLPHRAHLRKDVFLKKYGTAPATSASIPYSDTFGIKSVFSTLKEVALTSSVVVNSSGTPMYAFMVPTGAWKSKMIRDLPPPHVIASTKHNYSYELQFYLGGSGTGAPVHYHGHAINVLSYGVKDWIVYPPDYSFYSTIPALEYFTSVLLRDNMTALDALIASNTSSNYNSHSAENNLYSKGLRVRQYAGDILYIPSLWSHGTLNIQQSIGTAYEFTVEPFCME